MDNGSMSARNSAPTIEVNGVTATAHDLRHLVQTNYGHFSAMRIENGGVRGLDLHLQRIAAATRELFGTSIDPEHVRACLRHAIAGREGALSVRVNIFSRALNRERMADRVDADVLVSVLPAAPASAAPLRVKSFAFTRTLAHIKHVGTFPLFHYRRLAQQAGWDDALFVDAAGRVEEGSIWNVGFFDGSGIVWPDAPHLTGVSMQLLQAGIARIGLRSAMEPVDIASLGRFRSAFCTNSGSAVRLIERIDEFTFDADPGLADRLRACHDGNPLQAI